MAVKTAKPKAKPKAKAKAKVPAGKNAKAAKKVVKFTPTKLKLLMPVPSDIDIAQAGKIKPILQIAEEVGLKPTDLELFGPYKAKVHLDVRERLAKRPNGKYIDVTAITPTPLGEGKPPRWSACRRRSARIWATESSPASGSPRKARRLASRAAQRAAAIRRVIPMEDFNLHLTGDIHAITAAHNLMAAAIDARMLHERAQPDDEKLAKRSAQG